LSAANYMDGQLYINDVCTTVLGPFATSDEAWAAYREVYESSAKPAVAPDAAADHKQEVAPEAPAETEQHVAPDACRDVCRAQKYLPPLPRAFFWEDFGGVDIDAISEPLKPISPD
jgi:hypothetical protein